MENNDNTPESYGQTIEQYMSHLSDETNKLKQIIGEYIPKKGIEKKELIKIVAEKEGDSEFSVKVRLDLILATSINCKEKDGKIYTLPLE